MLIDISNLLDKKTSDLLDLRSASPKGTSRGIVVRFCSRGAFFCYVFNGAGGRMKPPDNYFRSPLFRPELFELLYFVGILGLNRASIWGPVWTNRPLFARLVPIGLLNFGPYLSHLWP